MPSWQFLQELLDCRVELLRELIDLEPLVVE
jgi:hypothetical protein